MDVKSVKRSQSVRFGIYRNTKSGWIAGVCAGIADRLAVKPIWVRLVFLILATVTHGILAVVLYVLMVMILEPYSVPTGFAAAPYPTDRSGYFADRLYPGNTGNAPPAAAPSGQLGQLAARFASLDARLNNIEAAVTSDEMSLRRKFRDLGG
jgi:phage shock protein C